VLSFGFGFGFGPGPDPEPFASFTLPITLVAVALPAVTVSSTFAVTVFPVVFAGTFTVPVKTPLPALRSVEALERVDPITMRAATFEIAAPLDVILTLEIVSCPPLPDMLLGLSLAVLMLIVDLALLERPDWP